MTAVAAPARRRATAAERRASAAPATELPIAHVAVDSGLAHLDRPFDYLVPERFAGAQSGCRVRVRFAGRLVDGFVLGRSERSEHERLQPVQALVSPEPVLAPELLALCRAVADRYAGSLFDVLRLAVPPRHARVEAEPRGDDAPLPGRPEAGSWGRYATGEAFLDALGRGAAPRAVWSALPGPAWPDELARALQACAASGRGAIAVVPDARDLGRVSAALGAVPHVALSAEVGPAERYRRWLRVLRGEVRVVVGTRAAAFAPVADLGLVAVWDDGDDLHAEPRAPYPHVREVLVLRAHLAGAALLVGGFARTAEGQLLVESGWARPLEAERARVRDVAPRVEGVRDDDLARDPLARAARLPGRAFEAARAALSADAPVLVQVPRRGYVPSLVCARDRTRARCPHCAGPLALPGERATLQCRWCGHLDGDWRCPECAGTQVRAAVVGARRTAEELAKAFPGVPLRTSGREGVLADVPASRAVVVATPGAEPVADGGYGAVLLLDPWAGLGRADLRAAEETLRRWFNAAALARPAADGGQVVVAGDAGLRPVQALVRWDPAGAAQRELAERAELGFPPAVRMAAVDGPPDALAEVAQAVSFELLGPVEWDGGERLLVRAPRAQGLALAAELKTVQATRSARKAPPVRVEIDPERLG